MSALRALLRRVSDLLLPRFVTEDVAIVFDGGDDGTQCDYVIVRRMADLRPGDRFDAVATADSFSWLGGRIGVTYRVGKFRMWPEPTAKT